MAYFGQLRYFESETHASYAQLLVSKFDLICSDIDLIIRCPSKVQFKDVTGSNDHHFRCLHTKIHRKHASHGMFWLILATFCDLTFLGTTFLFTRYLPQTHTNTFGNIELTAAHLNDPRAHYVKKKISFFTFDLWPAAPKIRIRKRVNRGNFTAGSQFYDYGVSRHMM